MLLLITNKLISLGDIMDIESLRYFVKLYEKRNFTRAAKELFITQQALSRMIIKLEDEIGGLLFIRKSRGATPTKLAKYMYPKAQNMIKDFDDFVYDIHNKVEAQKNLLKVGFAPGTLRILGVRELIEFGRAYLDIEVDIGEFSDVDCEANVLNGNIDLALTVKPNEENELRYIHYMKEKLIVIVNKDNPLAKKSSIKFEDLKGQKLILLDDTFRMQQVMIEHFNKAGFTADVYYKSSHDLKVVYDLVELNRGVFIFVEKLTNVEKYNNICCIPLDVPTAYWDAGFIVKKGEKMKPAAKKFINYFLNKRNLEQI